MPEARLEVPLQLLYNWVVVRAQGTSATAQTPDSPLTGITKSWTINFFLGCPLIIW